MAPTLRGRLHSLRRRPARERWAKYHEVTIRVLRHGLGGLWQDGHFDVRGAIAIARRYQPSGHDVPMHLFVTRTPPRHRLRNRWPRLPQGRAVTVHRLAGNHLTVLDQPQVEQVARMVLKSLREAQATATRTT